MNGETPVLDTLADITAASLEHNSLSPRELMLVRIAALIAVDAPAASYLANAGAAADSGITADDIQAIMIGVAPVVGTPRWSRRAGTSSGPSVWRSLWPTPRRPAKMRADCGAGGSAATGHSRSACRPRR